MSPEFEKARNIMEDFIDSYRACAIEFLRYYDDDREPSTVMLKTKSKLHRLCRAITHDIWWGSADYSRVWSGKFDVATKPMRVTIQPFWTSSTSGG